MGHDKLRKFAENETFRCLVQPASAQVVVKAPGGGLHLKKHPLAGRWGSDMFHSGNPVVLELGCGKGEYTVALARLMPGCNFIGVDIKGARLWRGAKTVTEQSISNAAFLRTRIEFIEAFFGPGEVQSIWLTFSDPQLKKEGGRLTSPSFLERYRRIMVPGGIVRLKTDSRFLYEYTLAAVRQNGLELLACTTDLYGDGLAGLSGDEMASAVTSVQTHYEKMFLAQGLKINYLAFRMPQEPVSLSGVPGCSPEPFRSPEGFDAAYWRSVETPRSTTIPVH